LSWPVGSVFKISANSELKVFVSGYISGNVENIQVAAVASINVNENTAYSGLNFISPAPDSRILVSNETTGVFIRS
jgi:hypothetical protein